MTKESLKNQEPLRLRVRRIMVKKNINLPQLSKEMNISLPSLRKFMVDEEDVKILVFFKIVEYVNEVELTEITREK